MEDIKEIKGDVKELLQRSAVHNELLRQHESRSLALQQEQAVIRAEIEPIKSHVHVVSLILKAVGLVSVGLLIHAASKLI